MKTLFELKKVRSRFKRIESLVLIILIGSVILIGCGRSEKGEVTTETDVKVATTEIIEATDTNEVAMAAGVTDTVTYSKDALLTDFDQLVKLIENSHPKLYTDTEALDQLIQQSRPLIKEGMTELEFFRLISPIAAKTDCGHTNLNLSKDTEARLNQGNVMFPLYLHWIDAHAYVTQNACADSVPIGAELISINGKPMAEIRELMLANFSSDGTNMTRKLYMLNDFFNYFYTLFVEDTSVFEIVYQTKSDSKPINASFEGVTSDVFFEKIEMDWADSNTPYTSAFEDDFAVITFNTFYPQGEYTLSDYKTFMDTFFKQVKDQGVERIILDVRGNGGGDPYVTSHLFSYLAKTEQPYFVDRGVGYYRDLNSNVPLAENRFTGKLAILMDGMSFSSTGHLLALLKFQELGAFFGEESGGSFACTDMSQTFVLSNTRIGFHSSTQVFEVAVTGLTPGRGIMPDYPVELTLEQYLADEDVGKNLAIEWLKEEQ